MTNLAKLDVSLTKHGAHKVAEILDQVQPDQVLANTWLTLKDKSAHDIKIDTAQARKTLSSLKDDKLPLVWHDAKAAGRLTIDGLVLMGIIFSHHQLIDAMKGGIKGFGTGVIKRADVDGGKGFTNFKDDFYTLGFATATNDQMFTFDISGILRDKGLGSLFIRLLRLKLKAAGWDGAGDAADECVSLGIHHALGMKPGQFKRWVSGDAKDLDELPEARDADKAPPVPFSFSAGHTVRKTGDVLKKGSGDSGKARLLHNDLQNRLYDYLCATYGASNIGTEITSGPPHSSIDIVRKDKKTFYFYELKTSKSLRKCIREAIPQLLEYAYWPNAERAIELVIVTANKPTSDAKDYLAHLRSKFSLPLFHETVDKITGAVSQRI